MSQSARRRLLNQMAAAARPLASDWSSRNFGSATPDTVAQAAICAAPILAQCTPDSTPVLNWLEGQLSDWECVALKHAVRLSTEYSVLSTLCPVQSAHLYDAFLQVHSGKQRKQYGVFFTPQPIADYIVRRLDDALRHGDFALPEGLAQSGIANHKSEISNCDSENSNSKSEISNLKSPIHFIDPACGTGVFLLALLELLHARRAADWNDFVPELLPRLVGIELLPAATFLAKLNIALTLAATGYDFRRGGQLQIHCGDALDETLLSQISNVKCEIPIVLGNPPFSSLSANSNAWIAQLVRGDDSVRGYVQAGEQRLGERKTWLHDDYVKFIRLAQWHVEQAGAGLVGFVTNRGYLDNATFRLMRQELMRVFPQIRLLDLHGSRKADEIAPSGERDENVFGLDQGVAIGIFSRPRTPVSSGVQYAELWGSRSDKLSALASADGVASGEREPPEARGIQPASPAYLFTPHPAQPLRPEYAAAWSLADAMPLNTTAPVTARDHFVVAFTPEELEQRIEAFRDLSIPDDEIRRRYFQRTRSSRYTTGDTRGWQLAAARRAVAADADWRSKIVRCLYRPFDWRFVFWHPAMIDWPRNEVTRHFVEGSGFRVQGSGRKGTGDREQETEGASQCMTAPVLSTQYSVLNSECPTRPEPRTPGTLWVPEPCPSQLCLIARRQQPSMQPCTYFWMSDGLALDGVIRSDNRGSESLFPLYVHAETEWRANFAEKFVAQMAAAAQLSWVPQGRGDLDATFGPEDLLAYIYALFHGPTYRERYVAALRTAIPRVLPPRSNEQFLRLSRAGHELIDLHLLRGEHSGDCSGKAATSQVESFRAGGYVALRKWLQPVHRSAADPQFGRITAAIERTLEIMQEIDLDCGAAS